MPTILFLDDYKWLSVRVVICCLGVSANEIDVVVHSDNLASCIGLDISLCNLP